MFMSRPEPCFSQPHSKHSSFRQMHTEAPCSALRKRARDSRQVWVLWACCYETGTQGSVLGAREAQCLLQWCNAVLRRWPACCVVLEGSTVRGMLTESRESKDHSSLQSSSSRPRGGYSPDTSPLPTPHRASSLFSFTWTL